MKIHFWMVIYESVQTTSGEFGGTFGALFEFGVEKFPLPTGQQHSEAHCYHIQFFAFISKTTKNCFNFLLKFGIYVKFYVDLVYIGPL